MYLLPFRGLPFYLLEDSLLKTSESQTPWPQGFRARAGGPLLGKSCGTCPGRLVGTKRFTRVYSFLPSPGYKRTAFEGRQGIELHTENWGQNAWLPACVPSGASLNPSWPRVLGFAVRSSHLDSLRLHGKRWVLCPTIPVPE